MLFTHNNLNYANIMQQTKTIMNSHGIDPLQTIKRIPPPHTVLSTC